MAISDAFGWTAQGIETVKINEAAGEFGIERINELVKEHNVTEFVVGYPKNMNNTIGPRGEASESYKKLLEDTFGFPVKLWDERLTTMAAERMLIEAKITITAQQHIGGNVEGSDAVNTAAIELSSD